MVSVKLLLAIRFVNGYWKKKLFISGIPPLIHFYLWQIVYHLANQFNQHFNLFPSNSLPSGNASGRYWSAF
jgi:hypothetical protein